ncbi:NF-kappa-p65 acetylation inhibitor [Orf virus]|uniref:NF-kappa-p65 acetylation inhibitor n=1 Tax=Orf virus TaxID=10258 RepID=A0A0R8I9V6_ORFV|nr:NF-kappa-p65 acetylation inhibitor [Orf virus]
MTPTSRESLLTTLLVEHLVRARRPSPALVRAPLARRGRRARTRRAAAGGGAAARGGPAGAAAGRGAGGRGPRGGVAG